MATFLRMSSRAIAGCSYKQDLRALCEAALIRTDLDSRMFSFLSYLAHVLYLMCLYLMETFVNSPPLDQPSLYTENSVLGQQ
jgi:hypothetical protein